MTNGPIREPTELEIEELYRELQSGSVVMGLLLIVLGFSLGFGLGFACGWLLL